ncbi:hypothetical protein KP509_26G011400 [Ceratopteris richardii]|uniref:NusG-like N-terminal domain-containing protein n=1 Tax=Ceratopteris richardii TaxID=49495 RepID=A0A8T2RK07_CERRI|nr:hypothetical protein KP509_26G011400 [Ceratopteris richardii]KAH7296154.1 hypothetical protein KP509_26G011400 [Ceratopteris richardii]
MMLSKHEHLGAYHPQVSFQSVPRIAPSSFVRVRCSGDDVTVFSSRSSARERRKERNERRMQQQEQGSSWREEIEELHISRKTRASTKGLKYELDMTRLTARGMQWWMVLVSMRAELSVAEDIRSALSREFADEKFELFVPSVPTKRILKDGSISPATRRLHAGCVFLRCVLRRNLYDVVRRVPRVRGFFGKRVGFYDPVIMPTPVPDEDIARMRRKVKEEESELERLQNLSKEERLNEHADIEEASKTDLSLKIGADIRVLNGSYTNFEGHITSLPDGNEQVETELTAFGQTHTVMLSLKDIEVLPR